MPQLGAASLRIGAFPKQIINCPFERGVLSQACLGEPVIKGLARLTALVKPCSLRGRDSGFIGSRVEETEARINAQVSEFSKVFVKKSAGKLRDR